MSGSTEESLAHARALISKLLEGSLSHAARDEGNVYSCVLYVEKYQPEWLLDQLRNPEYAMADRCEVMLNMLTHQKNAVEILGLRGTRREDIAEAVERSKT